MSKKKALNVNFDAEIPSDKLPYVEVVRPSWQRPVEAYIVCPKFIKVLTHYVNGFTQPHLEDPEMCDGCRLQRPLRFKGYFGGWDPVKKIYVLVEVTHHAALPHKARLEDPTANFRGMRVKTIRVSRSERGRCKLEFHGAIPEGHYLPGQFDAVAVLDRIWDGMTRKAAKRSSATAGDNTPIPGS